MTQAVGSRGSYKYITSYNSNNYNGTALIDAIVIHHWGEDGQQFENVINSLCGNRTASAHYVLEDSKVACLIAPGYRAWHVGSNDKQIVMQGITNVNSYTIGIECHPECSEGDRETLAQLISDLWYDYGIIPIYYHSQFMNTQCPGRYVEYLPSIIERAKEIYMQVHYREVGDNMSLTTDEIAFVKQLYAKSIEINPSDWAKCDVNSAVTLGLSDGSRPQSVASRQELMSMIVKAVKLLNDNSQ